MIRAWRIVNARNAATAFSGDGSRRSGGRWNSRGYRAVYLADSLALATLEVMVHGVSYETLQNYVCIVAAIPKRIIQEVDQKSLPRNWRNDLPPAELRELGDRWLNEQKSAALKVPSAVIPVEYNYILNPRHKDFGKIEIAEPLRLAFDKRLFG
ncbi:MAG TPA: RES domain-containing protein [Thermodesulfobacteriota bacterium]|nr:RES domain-containing protein [Thermodesulfobacteriota bacterium]